MTEPSLTRLSPALIELLTGQCSLLELHRRAPREAARALVWSVRHHLDEALWRRWLAQGLLAPDAPELRAAAQVAMAELAPDQLSCVIRDLKEIHHSVPRSTRRAVARLLHAFASQHDFEALAIPFHDALRHLHATLHIPPHPRAQIALFERRARRSEGVAWERPSREPALDAERASVHLLVDTGVSASLAVMLTRRVIDALLRQQLWRVELSQVGELVREVTPARADASGWSRALDTLVCRGLGGDHQALETHLALLARAPERRHVLLITCREGELDDAALLPRLRQRLDAARGGTPGPRLGMLIACDAKALPEQRWEVCGARQEPRVWLDPEAVGVGELVAHLLGE